tara:strand:+ start:108 stop:413 length:306 start_codon:yes stop_codon:yes gene_type:complete
MKNLPSEERPSTKLIRDLYKNRKKLVRIENSDSPFIKRINPLLKKDYWLSHALIKFLNYEYDLGIKVKNKKTENKSAIEKLKQMQSKLSEKMNCEEEEELF